MLQIELSFDDADPETRTPHWFSMIRVQLFAAACLLLQGPAIGAGFDGDAEHLKQTRRPIPILQGIGTVEFRITCQNPQTQLYFNQGIALVHGEVLRDADRSFYQACRIEPSCPMTWWGMAVANLENRPLAAFYVDRAVQLQDGASQREQQWISALSAYLNTGTSEADRRAFMITSLDRIATRYPDDLEACAFLVRQFLQNRDAGMPLPLTSAVDLLIEHVLRQNAAHPIHHYKLLLWERVQPERALGSTELVKRIVPSASRIQTAAGRVYSRLQRLEDALACFEKSAGISCLQIRRDEVHPTEIAGFIENAGLQIDHLALVGRLHESIELARQLIEMPHPETPAPTITERPSSAHAMIRTLRPLAVPELPPATIGQQKLLEILTEYRRWDDLLRFASSNYFESADRRIQYQRIYAVGLAHYGRHDASGIASQIDALKQLQSNPANPGTSLATTSLPTASLSTTILSAEIDAAIRGLQWCATAGNRQSLSLKGSMSDSMRQLVRLFPQAFDRETIEAELVEAPHQPLGVAAGLNQALFRKLTGQTAGSAKLLNELNERHPRMDPDLRGDRDLVRSVEGRSGPSLCWQPSLAPAFQLPDRHGQMLSLQSFLGRHVLVVFYLGAGCPHCIEQLRTFAPLKPRFDEAGLAVIAISTDSVAGLQKTFEVAEAADAIPFQLVSDEKLAAFREFGAYDTRDNEPLHGTFLIDRRGRILWHNIRREPFMATLSLLEEAQRVFSLQESGPRIAPQGISFK